MTYTTLIDTATLAALLAEHAGAARAGSPVVLVDCRFDLANPSAGESAFAQGRIPHAIYAHLDRDLSGVKTGTNGRHPLPTPTDAAATFGRMGIDSTVQVVAYDQDSGMFASRLWWLLRWLGHDRVAVLDGGLARWKAEGRALSDAPGSSAARTFVAAPRPDMVVSAAEIPAIAQSTDMRLVDARAPERFRGESESIDPVAGHIPGAVNHFFQRNLSSGRFLAPDALRTAIREDIGDVAGDRIVCYCGSGVTACHNLLALEHAGMAGAKLYPGSWSEWVSDPTRGVARG
ncbi:MAG: sulfurtransferase [Acidobacteria bacterium]|nr:sulfurtransferase [Acidobacteriota bacterium]